MIQHTSYSGALRDDARVCYHDLTDVVFKGSNVRESSEHVLVKRISGAQACTCLSQRLVLFHTRSIIINTVYVSR